MFIFVNLEGLWKYFLLAPPNEKNLCLHLWSVFRFQRFIVFIFGPSSIFVATLIQGRKDPLNFIMATTIDNELQTWAPLWGQVSVGKYYDVTMKQYMGKVNMFIIYIVDEFNKWVEMG